MKMPINGLVSILDTLDNVDTRFYQKTKNIFYVYFGSFDNGKSLKNPVKNKIIFFRVLGCPGCPPCPSKPKSSLLYEGGIN